MYDVCVNNFFQYLLCYLGFCWIICFVCTYFTLHFSFFIFLSFHPFSSFFFLSFLSTYNASPQHHHITPPQTGTSETKKQYQYKGVKEHCFIHLHIPPLLQPPLCHHLVQLHVLFSIQNDPSHVVEYRLNAFDNHI